MPTPQMPTRLHVMAVGRKVPEIALVESSHEEAVMANFQKFSRILLIAVAGAVAVVAMGSARATDLNPAAIKIQLPDQIKWVDDMKRGESSAILAGDPEMPGIYVELVKWHAHHMSRPHFHP